MYYLIYAAIIIMAVRCVSFAVSEAKDKNYIGAAATALLAAGSLYCGLYIFV